jgi:hypothetical protein
MSRQRNLDYPSDSVLESADSSLHREGGDKRSQSSQNRKNKGGGTKKGGQLSSRSATQTPQVDPYVYDSDEPPKIWGKDGKPKFKRNGYNIYGD